MSREDAFSSRSTNQSDLTNEEFRLLVERSTLLGDEGATDELLRYLLSKFAKKARAVSEKYGPSYEEDLVHDLLEKALKVASLTLEKSVDLPRNYTMRAVSNSFCTLIKRIDAKARRETHLEDDYGRATMDQINDLLNRVVLREFRLAQKDGTARKVAQVIELVYQLEISETSACDLLDFGLTETDTVLRTLRRWRSDPRFSPLWRLVDDLNESED